MMLDKLNEKLKHYEIQETPWCMGEDGEYRTARDGEIIGYAVVNKTTKVIEYSTMILPTAVFQADYFDNALESMLNPVIKDEDGRPVVVAEDVLIN